MMTVQFCHIRNGEYLKHQNWTITINDVFHMLYPKAMLRLLCSLLVF